MILIGKTGFMEMSISDNIKQFENKNSGEKENHTLLNEFILEVDENIRNKFIKSDKEFTKIIVNNTFSKSTEDKFIKSRLICNINKFYAETNSNEKFSDEEDFGKFIDDSPNIIYINLDKYDEVG